MLATRRKLTLLPRLVVTLVAAAAMVALWGLTVRFLKTPEVVFPAPTGVFRALWAGLFIDGLYWRHIGITPYQILAGFGIGACVGLFLGIAIAEVSVLRLVIHPYVIAFQNVPKVAIAPLFVIWFGFDAGSKIAIAATIAFFPVVINVIAGLNSADEKQIEMLQVFGGNVAWKFFLVRLPTALPFLFAGLDIAMVLAIVGSIVGEFVGAKVGLGYLIMQYNFTLDMNGIFAVLVIYTVIGYGLHLAVRTAQEYCIWWRAPLGERSV